MISNWLIFNICFDRKVKQRDTNIVPQADKTSEVYKLMDDHVFIKPAEPKSITVESKGHLSIDSRQNKDKLVSIRMCFFTYMFL